MFSKISVSGHSATKSFKVPHANGIGSCSGTWFKDTTLESFFLKKIIYKSLDTLEAGVSATGEEKTQ